MGFEAHAGVRFVLGYRCPGGCGSFSTFDFDLEKEISVIQVHQGNGAGVANLEAMLQDDPVNHVYRVDRSVFTDEQLFELEMKHIFESNWVYLAHESQIPNVNDYFTAYHRPPAHRHHARQGRQAQRGDQRLRAPRRDAVPPQAWQQARASPVRSTAGRSATPASCSRSRTRRPTPSTRRSSTRTAAHDLKKVARFESYRGFLFGSLQRRRPAAGRATWARRPRSSST